jgi:hypothetical protein
MSVCGHQHVLKPKWPILGVQMPSIILLLYDKLRIIKWGLSLVMLFPFALSFAYCLLFFCFRSLYLLLTYVSLLFNVTPLLHLPTHHNWTSFLTISIICFICFILLLLLLPFHRPHCFVTFYLPTICSLKNLNIWYYVHRLKLLLCFMYAIPNH